MPPAHEPPGAVRAEVALLYQTTSYESVRFLAGVGGDDPFLAGAGADLLAAWRATGMAEPVEMARLAVPEPDGALAAAVVGTTLGWCARRRRAPCTP